MNSSMARSLRGAVAVSSLFVAGLATAGPITYTFSTIASGSLGAISFLDRALTITAFGDTANVTALTGQIDRNNPVSAQVSVSGIGDGTFTSTIGVVVNRGIPGFGISDFALNRAVLFSLGPVELSTYDLLTALSPVAGSASFNTGQAFATSAGSFVLQRSGQVTASAALGQTVPEPSSLALAAIAALALVQAGRGARRQPAPADATV